MGFFSSIFTPDVASKAVDGIYNGIDKAFYTDEEKAEAVQKQLDTKLNLLPLFEPFKLAQRYIALLFASNFLLAFWVGTLILLYLPDSFTEYVQLVEAFGLFWVMGAIVTWYFTGGVINSMKDRDNAKGK